MSNVSRSVYQKVAEENKRLKYEIYILTVKPLSFEGIQIRMKWQSKFEKDKEFNAMLKQIAEQYFKENPELKIKIDSFSKK